MAAAAVGACAGRHWGMLAWDHLSCEGFEDCCVGKSVSRCRTPSAAPVVSYPAVKVFVLVTCVQCMTCLAYGCIRCHCIVDQPASSYYQILNPMVQLLLGESGTTSISTLECQPTCVLVPPLFVSFSWDVKCHDLLVRYKLPHCMFIAGILYSNLYSNLCVSKGVHCRSVC